MATKEYDILMQRKKDNGDIEIYNPITTKENVVLLNETLAQINAQMQEKAREADVVKLTGNQTVAGTKTFSSNPLSTASQSTNADALLKRAAANALVHTGNAQLVGNLNNFIDAGIQGVFDSTQTNGPPGMTHPFLIVFSLLGDGKGQLCLGYGTGGEPNGVFYRARFSGVWTAWSKL